MRPFDPALLRALPATRGPVAALSLVGVASGVLAIGQALTLALVVGAVVRGEPLQAYLTWLVALLLARGVLAGVGEVSARRAGLRVVAVVRSALLRRWLALPEGRRPGTEVALTRAGDGVSTLEPYVSRYLPALVSAAVVPALTVLTLLVVDPWSALIVVLTLPLLPLFASLIGMHTRDETRRRWDAMTLLAGHFLDVMRGLPTLVGYGRAHAQVGVVREVGDRHRRATVTTLRTAFLSTAALELLATISVAMVAVAVGLRLAYGQMDLVVGLTAILLAPEAYWPIRRVGAEVHNAADGAAVLEDLAADGVLGPEVDRPGSAEPVGSAAGDGTLGLHDVRYAHPGRVVTLVGVSLTTPARPGLTALTGPSGSGKTTVLELLAGLRTPASGTVSGAAHTHLATQRPLVLPGTVRDNLALARATDDAEMTEALQRVGLWAQLTRRDGLDTVLGDDGLGLSAGQRARLALARASLSDAALLLLDEPTANVAAHDVRLLHEVILELAERRRVVVVTHDPVLAAVAGDRWQLTNPGAETVCHIRRPDDGGDTPFLHRDAPGQVAPVRTPGGRRGLVLACLLGGASLGCGVALTATSGWLIVQASTMPVVMTLLVAIVGVRAFGLFRPVLRYAERVVSHDVALEDLARRRADLFAGLIPLTPARLGRRSRGELLAAMAHDLDDVVDDQVRVVVPAWSAVIASLVGAGLAAWHLPWAGAAVATGALLVLGVAALGTVAEGAAQQDAVAHRGRLHHHATMLTANLLPIQAVTGLLADRTALLAPLEAAGRDQRRSESRLIRARALTLVLTWTVVAATTAVVAALVWQAHADGVLSGPYAALVTLVPLALADVWVGIADIAGARARSRAATARLQAVLDQRPAVAGTDTRPVAPTAARSDERGGRAPAGLGPAGLDLRLDRVSARWAADDAALGKGIPPDLPELDLHLAPGDRVRLTGPNGAGKSTALAVLARHLDPESGTFLLDEADVLDLDLEQTRSRLAVVDDEPHAFAGSVRANLALAAPDPEDAPDDVLLSALRAVDLEHWFATLPEGLDTPLSGLSGGERARLSLARALVSQRPVLLLDEPAAHLDDATAQRALTGALTAVDPATRIVLVSHTAPASGDWHEVSVDATLGRRHTASPPRLG
ncbi:thiol reductant ABC exporter subunit CydC [Ornithinimicrobium sp. LYQ92]|uniref:thiol reductant ABC exporter subunit CydC n=1 Tax=Serinicoccus sp. LYQ92 TaxID=3378798 RepID=UPI0038548824